MSPSLHRADEQRASAFARLFEAVHEGVFIGTLGPKPDSGATRAANPHLKLIFGYATDAPEREVTPFAPARFADEAARAAFIGRLASEGAVTDYLLRLRRIDGSAVWVEVTARAEPSSDAAIVHIEALVRDVSERKKLDDQSRDLYQQLLQAEKMAALGQTISGVAHELNNPLATILSWAERLAEKALDDTSQRGIEVILGESERAARIVRNLLTFARKHQSTRSMVDVNQVVRETLTLRSYEQRLTNIEVITALAAGLPQVFADAHQIQQVLLNLVINAEQAMLAANGRGSLVLRTWHDADRDSVVLEVTDDGRGFDPARDRPRIVEGHLGLAAVKERAALVGGEVTIESARGRGTTLRLVLPAGAGGPGQPEGGGESRSSAAASADSSAKRSSTTT